MGLSGISPMSLLLILAIILLLFGSTKVKDLGGDLGEAIKRFRKSVQDSDQDDKS